MLHFIDAGLHCRPVGNKLQIALYLIEKKRVKNTSLSTSKSAYAVIKIAIPLNKSPGLTPGY